MTRAERRQLDKGAIELIEEAFQLLRRAPAALLAIYYAGSLPFVLALLYFWADMSRSPFADRHVAGAALGMGGLFLWMKFCHALFARRLRAVMTGESLSALSWRHYGRIFLSQAAVQPTGLFLLVLALVLAVPFAWVYAFYQNFTALDERESSELRIKIREALQQALLSPKQNHLVLAILFGFSFFVFLNWIILCLVLPGLVKTLFGVESIFSRGSLSLLNTTFFAVMVGLTYLSVDPFFKASYVLRCFYGQSRRSGQDLKIELRQQGRPARLGSSALLALFLLTPFGLNAASSQSSAPVPQVAPVSAPPPELDRAINQVLQQQKYTWRMPREKLEGSETAEKGIIGRFMERVRQWLRSIRDWLIKWVRKIFGTRNNTGADSSGGYGWIVALQLLLCALAGAVIVALVVLLFRVLRPRKRPVIVPGEPLGPAPDLTEENISVQLLPEAGWLKLGRELLERGELRLALRAFYLATLAHLAARNLISPAKFKSNRDYELELRRRGHSMPELLSIFGDNSLVFERIWYGLHEINQELVQQFLARVEQIRVQSA